MPDPLTFVGAIPMAFLALLPVINPIGTAIVLAGFTNDVDRDTRITIARRVAINTALILAVVLLVGRYLLAFFGVSVPVVQLAGGFVLAALGWRLLNQEPKAPTSPTAPACPCTRSPS